MTKQSRNNFVGIITMNRIVAGAEGLLGNDNGHIKWSVNEKSSVHHFLNFRHSVDNSPWKLVTKNIIERL